MALPCGPQENGTGQEPGDIGLVSLITDNVLLCPPRSCRRVAHLARYSSIACEGKRIERRRYLHALGDGRRAAKLRALVCQATSTASCRRRSKGDSIFSIRVVDRVASLIGACSPSGIWLIPCRHTVLNSAAHFNRHTCISKFAYDHTFSWSVIEIFLLAAHSRSSKAPCCAIRA